MRFCIRPVLSLHVDMTDSEKLHPPGVCWVCGGSGVDVLGRDCPNGCKPYGPNMMGLAKSLGDGSLRDNMSDYARLILERECD